MKAALDKGQFGPWALVTGASSGIGKEFARRNRSKVIPGRLNRILNALVPASLARKIEADLIDKGLAIKSASALTRGLAT